MKVLCVGLNWKTPIAVRERLAFDADQSRDALGRLAHAFPAAEFVIISTCNRTEIYAAWPADKSGVSMDDLAHFLAEHRDISIDSFYPHLYVLESSKALRHLFDVTGGLDSLVLGEGQILAQVKEAYQRASDIQCAGPMMHAVFQRALHVAKRIRTETDLAKGRLSIASAAIDYVQGVFETFSDKCILIIGAGKMAELTVTHLRDFKPARLIVANRHAERAEALARKFGGESWPWPRLRDALIEADIVVTSSAADEPIIRADEFVAIMKSRRQRLVAIIDIAVPRDVDVAVGELPNVLLWNIDDLEKVRNKTLRARRSEMQSAGKIIAEELSRLQSAWAAQKTGPLISQLDQEYQRIIEEELSWLFPQLNGLPEGQADKIRQFAHRVKNKLLHSPKIAIREQAQEGHHGLLETVQRLFGLGRPSAGDDGS